MLIINMQKVKCFCTILLLMIFFLSNESAYANNTMTIDVGTIGKINDTYIKYNGTNHYVSRFYLAPGISENAVNTSYPIIKGKIYKLQYHYNSKSVIKFKVIGIGDASITITIVE